jgi:hypothetical protein
MFTDEELRATMRAGARWATERDISDPVGWADLVHTDDTTIQVIRGRTGGEIAPAKVHCMPLPKGVGAELRYLTVPDPFDDIVFRALVGRSALAIDNALGVEVTSYRLVETGPGWRVRNYRYATERRIEELRGRISNPNFQGLGILDVRNYYPSINVARLRDILAAVGVDPADAAAIADYLAAWHLWGVCGIPIGPEASGLLGNIYLLPVDQALRTVDVEFSRYTDDYRLWLAGPASWSTAQDAVAEGLGALGLQANPGKTRHLRTPHGVLMKLANPDLDALKELLRSDPDGGLLATLDAFDEEVAKPVPDPKRLKFLLGVLRNRRSPYAISAVQNRVELLQADPKAWGSYLKIMHGHRLLDLDWLLQAATAPVTKETAAAAYHLMGVVAVGHVGREHGQVLGEFATNNDRDWTPVRCAAAEAWSKSEDWKATKAAEVALAVGDVQQRRALALTMRRATQSPSLDKALTQLHRTVPECRPTVTWIRDGAHIAA